MSRTEVRSAARVLELLEFLARVGGPVSLKDAAAALRLPKSSAHGLLQTLVTRGYAERDSAERYQLAPALSAAGWIGGPDARLAALARPVMEQLRDDLRETVFLGARGPGDDVKLLAKLLSPEIVRYDSETTSLRPAYCTAMGRVLLAFAEPGVVDAYLARTVLKPLTPHTVTNPEKLRATLVRIRSQGFDIVEEELTIGGSGAAAPVFGADGNCRAALNVATVTQRFPAARDRIIAGVRAAAEEISRRLGFLSPPVAA
jgi:DNA-binding IclR family transcriptional regulator